MYVHLSSLKWDYCCLQEKMLKDWIFLNGTVLTVLVLKYNIKNTYDDPNNISKFRIQVILIAGKTYDPKIRYSTLQIQNK